MFKTIEIRFGASPQLDQSGISSYFRFSTRYPKLEHTLKPGKPDIIPFR